MTGLPGLARSYGLGVPTIAIRTPRELQTRPRSDRFLPKFQQSYPETVLIQFDGSITERAGAARPLRRATGELHDPLRTESVEISGRTVPIEADLTTPLAYMLDGMEEISGFDAMLDPENWEQYN